MLNRASNTPLPPYKSVAAALMLAAVLGPLGLLYSSFRGALIMIILGALVVSTKLTIPILIIWTICCIWAVRSVEKYNKKIMEMVYNKI